MTGWASKAVSLCWRHILTKKPSASEPQGQVWFWSLLLFSNKELISNTVPVGPLCAGAAPAISALVIVAWSQELSFLLHDVMFHICTLCCSGTFFSSCVLATFSCLCLRKLTYEGLELLSRFLYAGRRECLRGFLLCLDRLVVWVSKIPQG